MYVKRAYELQAIRGRSLAPMQSRKHITSILFSVVSKLVSVSSLESSDSDSMSRIYHFKYCHDVSLGK